MRKPEQDFLRFCRKGDSRALARVFDRLAPELLLLALHLTGDHSRAEDLIQETFLRAMESADRFRHGNPLRPWLVGILTNAAREARRGAQERSGGASPIEARESEGPLDRAQNHELVERLGRVVESLPTTYHQVLILRLSRGMNAVEIAHTLGRPPKTVQTQMRRGMELLRKALPAGFTLPVVLASVPGRGLAAVRSVVMERAASSVGTAAVLGFVLGSLLLGKILIPVALVGGLGYLALAERTPDAAAESPQVEGAMPASPAPVAAARAGESESQDPVGDPDRTRLEAPEPTGAVVRGRLVAAETGRPVPGTVGLVGWVRNSEREALYGDAPRLDLEDFVTGADGLFELVFPPHPAHGFLLNVEAEGRGTMRCQWEQLAGGDIVELGDVRAPLGASVQGRLTDERGLPVEGLRLQVRQAGLKVPGSTDVYPKESAYTTRSGPDGTFLGAEPLVPGVWEVLFSSRNYELVGPESLVVAGGDRVARLDVVLRPVPEQPTISGVVVDESGLPVSGVSLRAVPGWFGSLSDGRGRSGADGEFTIYREGDQTGPVRIEQDPISESAFAMISGDSEYEWGVDDVRIVVQRPVTVNLRVVEAGTNVSVEDFSVRCFPMPQTGSLMTKMKVRGNHRGGRVVLEDVRVGRNALIVYPLGEDLVPSEPMEFEAAANGTGLRVELQRKQPLTVVVLRGDGTPVVGTEIELLRKEGSGTLRRETISGRPYQAYSRFYGTVMGIVLDAGVTDAEGSVVLEGPVSRGGLAIKAKGPGYRARLETRVSLEPGNPPLVFRVSTGAAVRGRLEPAGALEDLGPAKLGDDVVQRLGPNRLDRYRPSLFLKDPSGRRFPGGPLDEVSVDQDGTFSIQGIPPGSWDVYLRHTQPGGGSADRRLGIVAGLKDEESREVRFGIAHLQPGTLSSQVFLDGEAYTNRSVTLRWSEPGEQGWRLRDDIETDAEGRFSVEVAPGNQRLLVNLDTAYGVPIVSAEVAHVPGGQAVDRVFDLVRSKIRLRILESDGSPATGRGFWIGGSVLSHVRNAARTDGEGWLVIDPAPREPLSLTTWPLGMDEDAFLRLPVDERQPLLITLGPVQLPPGKKDGEFVLELGEKK